MYIYNIYIIHVIYIYNVFLGMLWISSEMSLLMFVKTKQIGVMMYYDINCISDSLPDCVSFFFFFCIYFF